MGGPPNKNKNNKNRMSSDMTQLKTFLYKSAFNLSQHLTHRPTPAPQIRWLSSDIVHTINLLTYLQKWPLKQCVCIS